MNANTKNPQIKYFSYPTCYDIQTPLVNLQTKKKTTRKVDER